MLTSDRRAQFTATMHVLTTALSFAARATLGVLVGGLFLFYTSISILATRNELLLGNHSKALIGVVLIPVALGSAIATFYALSNDSATNGALSAQP